MITVRDFKVLLRDHELDAKHEAATVRRKLGKTPERGLAEYIKSWHKHRHLATREASAKAGTFWPEMFNHRRVQLLFEYSRAACATVLVSELLGSPETLADYEMALGRSRVIAVGLADRIEDVLKYDAGYLTAALLDDFAAARPYSSAWAAEHLRFHGAIGQRLSGALASLGYSNPEDAMMLELPGVLTQVAHETASDCEPRTGFGQRIIRRAASKVTTENRTGQIGGLKVAHLSAIDASRTEPARQIVTAATPEDLLVGIFAREEAAFREASLDRLTEHERRVYELMKQGRSETEIAEMLGRKVGTIRSWRARIKAKVRMNSLPEK